MEQGILLLCSPKQWRHWRQRSLSSRLVYRRSCNIWRPSRSAPRSTRIRRYHLKILLWPYCYFICLVNLHFGLRLHLRMGACQPSDCFIICPFLHFGHRLALVLFCIYKQLHHRVNLHSSIILSYSRLSMYFFSR